MAARTRSRFDREEAPPPSDVYTGLLAISLIAMVASCVLLWLDYSQYGSSKAPVVPAVQPTPPRPVTQGALPPPPPLEERPFTKAPDAMPSIVRVPEPTPIRPVGGTEAPVPAPVMPAIGESPLQDPLPLPKSVGPTPPK
jgi:hypothetical protein